MSGISHIEGVTFHGRKGGIQNAFRYGVDYVLFDPSEDLKLPLLFSRNGANVVSLHDSDHGGDPKQGAGLPWAHEVLKSQGLMDIVDRVELLAQPRVLGHVFNPVSFWLGFDADGGLRVVIPEVSNTYGDRHCYLCFHDDQRVIRPTDTLTARKIFYVSPFQPVEGSYTFRFDFTGDKVGVWIDYTSGENGLLATLTGKRTALTNSSILRACLRRPFGSRRVLGLIHWQALKLWWKGAKFRSHPTPPAEKVSR
ncbi:DUF1365 domain-containing protein [Litoreibacter janthinus]|uniref:Cyclopropane-fatty-acyl-phospholipid synthase n=1 Tax=Litoreibacter janthinus TaxID=670154 RepID=A0A1I6G3Z9_9RHOB|nr:DUF1365 domain-containing protein [Litoreibacter janthinus]SFR36777.1 hypothetical protein SAMN04488002_0837 [Litoreibacter janthinus]